MLFHSCRPPLPPKSKHFSRRSFDTDWPDSFTPTTTSAGPSSPRRMPNHNNQQQHTSCQHESSNPNLVVAPVVSLDQWLEQSNCASSSTSNVRVSISNAATCDVNSSCGVAVSSSSSQNHHNLHQQQQLHSYQYNSSTSGGGLLATTSQLQQHQQGQEFQGDSSLWTNSTIYVGRPTTHSTASDSLRQEQIKPSGSVRNRTYSDSYQLEYDDRDLHHHHLDSSGGHLDRLVSDFERRSVKSGTTHNSLSLSLGSSLDNLLLVDAQSQQGLSPNSNTSGTGCTGAMHSLSGSSGNHPSDATGRLTGNFQDLEADEDVFVTEVADGCRQPPMGRYHLPPQASTRLNKQSQVQDECDHEIPPELPEKRRIKKHFTVDQGYLGMGGGSEYSCYSSVKQQQPCNARCHSPYDNVDENDSILQCWPATDGYKNPGQQQPFMTQSESRVTLVGSTAGNDSDERPPLPPKKKHSLIAAYVEFMHNFDLHSQRHQHFCNHYAARNHHFMKDQEGISSDENSQHSVHHQHLHQQGFHRHYLSERSATMFNPSTGELPGFTSTTSSSASRAHAASFVGTGAQGGGVNRAALYSASYHHFSTFSNSSLPSEENSPTHQHHPLTGSSSSTSHSLSEHASGGESGNEAKPPLPPKKSRSILRGLLGDMSKDSSLENDKSGASINNHGHENGTPANIVTTPISPEASVPPASVTKNNGNLSPVRTQQMLTSPTVPELQQQPSPIPTESTSVSPTPAPATTTPGSESNNNGSNGKNSQRNLDEDSIDLFMIDPTPLLVINKNPTTKSSPPTSTSSSSANSNANSKQANNSTASEGQLEVKGAEPMVLLVYATSPDVVGEITF